MKKFQELFQRYYDIIVYLVFGVLTTIVNYAVFLPLYNIAGCSIVISNGIAWIAAVLFAYLTNKPFVFRSHDWSAHTVIPELAKFVSCRIASGIMETVILFIAVDCMHMNGNIWKLITQILVVIANYVGSKLLVFRKR